MKVRWVELLFSNRFSLAGKYFSATGLALKGCIPLKRQSCSRKKFPCGAFVGMMHRFGAPLVRAENIMFFILLSWYFSILSSRKGLLFDLMVVPTLQTSHLAGEGAIQPTIGSQHRAGEGAIQATIGLQHWAGENADTVLSGVLSLCLLLCRSL